MSESSIAPPQPLMEGSLSLELETAYQSALGRLRKQSSRALGGLLLVGSLVAFLLVQRRESGTALNLAVLAGVLFFHEAGHWLAMRLFGWRDLKMFFIPFLGAAVSGKRNGAESWKEGVVLLAGPVPGIVVGLALAAMVRTEGSLAVRTLAAMLIAINAFNLLPLAVLDGGKLLQLTLFQRHRKLEVAFLVVASVGLLGASLLLDDTVMRYAGIGTLVVIPLRHKLLRAAQKLREKQLELPSDARELEGETGREVFRHAWDTLAGRSRRSGAQVASAMESLVDLVSRTVPSKAQTSLLLAAWVVALAAGGGGIWLLRHPAMRWRAVQDPAGAYTAWFPGEPAMAETEGMGGAHFRKLTLTRGDYGYLVVDTTLPAGAQDDVPAWRKQAVDDMARGIKGRVEASETKEFLGNPGFEATFVHGTNNRLRLIGFTHGGHRYVLMGTAPAGDPSVQQFLDSFDLRS